MEAMIMALLCLAGAGGYAIGAAHKEEAVDLAREEAQWEARWKP